MDMDQLFQHLRFQCSNDALKRSDYQFCNEIENIVLRLQHRCHMQKILSVEVLRNDIIAGSIQRQSALLPWFQHNQCMFVYHVLTEIVMRGAYSHSHPNANTGQPQQQHPGLQQQQQQQQQHVQYHHANNNANKMRKFEFAAENHRQMPMQTQANYQSPPPTHAAHNTCTAYQPSPTTSTPECQSNSPHTQCYLPGVMEHKANYSYSSSRGNECNAEELSAPISVEDDVQDIHVLDDDNTADASVVQLAQVNVVPAYAQHVQQFAVVDEFAIWMQQVCGYHTSQFHSLRIPIATGLAIEYSVRDLIEYLQRATLSNFNAVWQHEAIAKNEDELIGEKKALWLCIHTLLCLGIKDKYRCITQGTQPHYQALLAEFNQFPQHAAYLHFLTAIINALCEHFVRRSLRQQRNANHLSLRDNISTSDIVMGFGDLVEELPVWLVKVSELILRQQTQSK